MKKEREKKCFHTPNIKPSTTEKRIHLLSEDCVDFVTLNVIYTKIFSFNRPYFLAVIIVAVIALICRRRCNSIWYKHPRSDLETRE